MHKVQKATLEDVKAIQKLFSPHGFFMKHELEDTIAEGGMYIVKESESGDLLGAASFYLTKAGYISIKMIASSPGSKAVGWTLMESIKALNKDIKLSVDYDNPVAINFYEKHGFVRTDTKYGKKGRQIYVYYLRNSKQKLLF